MLGTQRKKRRIIKVKLIIEFVKYKVYESGTIHTVAKRTRSIVFLNVKAEETLVAKKSGGGAARHCEEGNFRVFR